MEYRINVNNKFAAIEADDDNEADPIEALMKLQEQLILSKKTAATAKKPAVGVTKKNISSTVASKNDKNFQKSNSGAAKPGNARTAVATTNNATSKSSPSRPQVNKFSERPPRFAENVSSGMNEAKPFESWGGEAKPDRDEPFRGRGGYRRGGYNRGGRGGHDGLDRNVKREFDRHSGSDKSGLKPHEKREGGGAHNWGSVKDDIADHMNNAGVSDLTDTNRSDPTEENVLPDQPVVDGEAEVKKEPEEKQLTLDEWKKLEDEKRVKSQFNIRKANEGCSDPKWNKMFVLKKKEDDEEEEYEEEDDDDSGFDGKKSKNVVPIRITFNDARRGNRGRGGRGGPGGSRRNDGDVMEKKKTKEAPAPNVADEKDFPSLS
ncbi:hypothetical protein HELRODRAFT_188995 [Helobdella robusta]|uniref:Hyaluronan/mRNA-binding protein domain-containing protein n=1 Tax=Helobdella robusta TaxID=6412 RepID=T1FQJ5_HELRO|nr:hypothetical protein HELRODRAFT_188995 [Helobdella robusta]ESN99083.1 hypothetical protein HELRODRAFT_188995 [Helobdella robusta]